MQYVKFSFSEKATNIYVIFLMVLTFKVQLFWEDHKNVRNRPYGFEIYLVYLKTMRTIAQIFVAFAEKLNFTAVQQYPRM